MGAESQSRMGRSAAMAEEVGATSLLSGRRLPEPGSDGLEGSGAGWGSLCGAPVSPVCAGLMAFPGSGDARHSR